VEWLVDFVIGWFHSVVGCGEIYDDDGVGRFGWFLLGCFGSKWLGLKQGTGHVRTSIAKHASKHDPTHSFTATKPGHHQHMSTSTNHPYMHARTDGLVHPQNIGIAIPGEGVRHRPVPGVVDAAGPVLHKESCGGFVCVGEVIRLSLPTLRTATMHAHACIHACIPIACACVPRIEEQPGPPVSHTTTGSFWGSLRDSKYQ
jgi:hypothetical protein